MPHEGPSVDDLTPLPTSDRITDTVYESLRNAIFSGALPPGTKLSVPALAEKLKVSRSPVREAVVRLTQDRLAFEAPRRGAVVAQITADELAQLYDVREVLEGVATRLATEHANARLHQRLNRIVTRHEEAVAAGDLDEHTRLDMQFHQLVREASGNPYVVRMLDDIQTQVRLAMVTTTVTGGPDLAVADHRAILEAITSGDAQKAENTAKQHVACLAAALRRQSGTSER